MSQISKVGERRIKGLLISRIIVIIALIFIPISMFILFNITGEQIFKMEWLPIEWKDEILLITPWLYSIAWIFMIILFADRISGSIDSVDSYIQVVPNRLSIYYGTNALVVLIIFAIPLATPLIAVISFASFGYRITTFRKEWENDTEIPKFAIITAIIFAAIPVMISIAVLPDFIAFSNYIWVNYWVPNLQLLYNLSMAICTSLAFGSIIILFKTGVAEYEHVKTLADKEIDLTSVKILEGLLFGFIILLQVTGNLNLLNLMYNIGLILVIIVAIINWIKGRSSYADFKSYSLGYILTIILYGANILSMNYFNIGTNETAELIRTAVLIISAVTYLSIYIIVFFKWEEN